ncbi:MOB kinase activator-like 2, partial [Fragariocoptes setiger]
MSDYLRETFNWLMGKTRRRDNKDASNTVSSPHESAREYLQDANLLQCWIPETKLRELVELPVGMDQNEWLASHTLAFFDHINLLYGTISEFCTVSDCPDMIGPGNKLYLWQDEKGKRLKLTAPHYIDYVMTFTQKTINDELIFPTKFDKDFPPTFDQVVKKIHQLLFHVLAHIYHSHIREIYELKLHPHLNCIFAHLVLFNLVEQSDLEVLRIRNSNS